MLTEDKCLLMAKEGIYPNFFKTTFQLLSDFKVDILLKRVLRASLMLPVDNRSYLL